MAKKRKASGQSKSSKAEVQSSKLAINTYEDVADSEDEFHINRDKILLDEGPEAKRRRKWKEEDQLLEPSDEEVLAYSGQSDDDEDEDEDDEEDGYDEPAGRRGMASDDSGSEGPAGEEDEEDEEAWGSSKKDYYDADAIETEQDALDEEKEALRLQKKHLERMTEADFGFDESEWLDADKEEDVQEADGEVVTEVLPQVQITDDMSPADRLKILKSRYPEFEPLSKEFLDLQPLHNELALAAAAAQKMQQQRAARITGQSKNFKTPTAVIKYRALAAYLAALTMYFALLTSTSSATSDGQVVALSPAELRDHPVMEGLVQCRTLWSKVKGLSIANKIADSDTSNELEAIEEEPNADVSPMDIEPRTSEGIMAPPKLKKKTKAQRAAETAQAAAEAKRAERLRRTEEELAALSTLTDKDALRKAAKAKKPKKPSAVTFANDEDSDFGDETELTKYELDEKLRKKKSLRFYTSQIAQKQNKRGAAGKDAGGDADIPYRERLKDRQARLNAEAEKRGKKALAPEQELGGDSDEEDRQQARRIRDEAASEDDEYYDMVAAHSKQKKTDKAAAAAAYAQAAREGAQVVETEEIGPDGKRKISYAIAKNKGLTPHRKKDVRNPRVKKKKKYEEKKKKLSSIRQVYKGGEGRGGYKGEMTGIKKGLVKSIKL